MKKILSIDGGGIRGLIPALVPAEIEKRTGRAGVGLLNVDKSTDMAYIY